MAQAPCAVAIRTARAVVKEVPAVGRSSVGALARCHLTSSERDTGRVTKRFGLKLPIPLSKTRVGVEWIRFIQMTDWAKFILQSHLWHRLCGLSSPDEKQCSEIWTSFWKRYKEIDPNHSIFKRKGHDFARTCALLLHCDEGRSLKKSPLMVIAAHSILGFGLSTSSSNLKNKYRAQKLNYEQPTWVTRFLLSVLPRKYYGDEAEDDQAGGGPFQDLVDAICADLRHLSDEGIETEQGTFYFCVVKVMGDWPFIQKFGNLGRSFMNISKAASSRAAPKGICHLCKADMVGVEWENFSVRPPTWVATVNTLTAFVEEPAYLQLEHNECFPEDFLTFDLFHAWHIGCGRTFLASALAILAASSAFAGGIDSSLEKMTAEFVDWMSTTGNKCQLRKITRAKLGWPAATTYPAGTWSKGKTSTVLMVFFGHVHQVL